MPQKQRQVPSLSYPRKAWVSPLPPLTEMISAREILGAMLRMKREHVLCRGRGLHSSPGAFLGFSSLSFLGLLLSLSALSTSGAVGAGENLLLGEGKTEKLLSLPQPVSPKRAPSLLISPASLLPPHQPPHPSPAPSIGRD